MTGAIGTGAGSPRVSNTKRATKQPIAARGNRKITGHEAGRIKRARAQLNGASGPMPWDDPGLSRVEAVIMFLESLPITKGILQGQTMTLLPHQIEFLRMVYGVDPPPKIGVMSLPRGNGKTALIANLALCHMVGPEAERRGAVYSAAVDRNQAALTFAEIEATIHAVPHFSARCGISAYHKRITVLEGRGEGTTYHALSADAPRAFGLAPSLWLYDELAQVPNRKLLDALITSTGKRARALGIIISTQAEDDIHSLSQLIDEALAGKSPDVVCQLMAAPMDADPFDVETLRACNPAIGHFLSESDLVADADMARRSYAFEPSFRNKRLNQRILTDADARLVDAATWNLGAIPVNEASLIGKTCICGFDNAFKHDLVALVMAFPAADGSYDVLCRFWTPLGQLDGRRPAERELFRQWLDANWLIGVPGPIIDPEWIAREFALIKARFKVQDLRYDRTYIDSLKLAMSKVGVTLPITEFGQGYLSMGPALRQLGDLLRAGKVRHGGHPVLTYCMGNAVVVSDPAGNLKFDKGRSHSVAKQRIDGAVALAMAVAPGPPPEPPRDFRMMFI